MSPTNTISVLTCLFKGYLSQTCSFLDRGGLASSNRGRGSPAYKGRPFGHSSTTVPLQSKIENRIRTKQVAKPTSKPATKKGTMKLHFVCLILVFLSMTTRNLHAFTIQTQVIKDPDSLMTHNAEDGIAETSDGQALLRRSKRFNSHFPLCTYCCNCCSNRKCGFCCRT